MRYTLYTLLPLIMSVGCSTLFRVEGRGLPFRCFVAVCLVVCVYYLICAPFADFFFLCPAGCVMDGLATRRFHNYRSATSTTITINCSHLQCIHCVNVNLCILRHLTEVCEATVEGGTIDKGEEG